MDPTKDARMAEEKIDIVLHNLFVVLQDIRLIQARMLVALRDEQDAVVKLNDQKLSEVVLRKNKLLTMLGVTDSNRSALFEKISDYYEVKESVHVETLSELMALVDKPVQEQFKKILRSLRFFSKCIAELNQVNEMVLEESLKRIQMIRKNLSSLMGVDYYNAAGQVVSKL